MNNIKISSLKKQAKSKRKNNNNIKNQSDSLNVIAREKGYKNWQELLNSAEVRVKANIQNYHFLSKEELDSLSLEDLKKHNIKIRRQWQNTLIEEQTIESKELNDIAFKYLKELNKKIKSYTTKNEEIDSEPKIDLKNVMVDLAKKFEGSSKKYNLNGDFLDYDARERKRISNKFKTMDDYSFYIYLINSYENSEEQIPEELLTKSKIFCPSFINLITAARTNKVFDINLSNINEFLNINYLEQLLWNEKIIKELKTEMLLFLEDIGYKSKTPLDPNPKNSEKVLEELNFYFSLIKFK